MKMLNKSQFVKALIAKGNSNPLSLQIKGGYYATRFKQ